MKPSVHQMGFIMKYLSASALSLLFLLPHTLQASASGSDPKHAPGSLEEFFNIASQKHGVPAPQQWSLHSKEDFDRIFNERVANLPPRDAQLANIQKSVFEAKTQNLVRAQRQGADLGEICEALKGTLTFLHQEQLKALAAGASQDENKHFFFSALSFSAVQEMAKLIPILTAQSFSYSKKLNDDKELPHPFLDKDAFDRTMAHLSHRIAFHSLYETLRDTPYIFGLFNIASTLSKKLVPDTAIPVELHDQLPLTVCKHIFYGHDICFEPMSRLIAGFVDEKNVPAFEDFVASATPEKREEVANYYGLCAALMRQQAPFFDDEKTGASLVFKAYATLMQSYADRIMNEFGGRAVMGSSSSSSQEAAPPPGLYRSTAKARRSARAPNPAAMRAQMKESLEARIDNILKKSQKKYAPLGEDATGELVLIASRLSQNPHVPELSAMVEEMEKITKILDARLATQRREILERQRSQASSSTPLPFAADTSIDQRNERASVLKSHLAAGTLTKEDLKPKKKAPGRKGTTKRGKKRR